MLGLCFLEEEKVFSNDQYAVFPPILEFTILEVCPQAN